MGYDTTFVTCRGGRAIVDGSIVYYMGSIPKCLVYSTNVIGVYSNGNNNNKLRRRMMRAYELFHESMEDLWAQGNMTDGHRAMYIH